MKHFRKSWMVIVSLLSIIFWISCSNGGGGGSSSNTNHLKPGPVLKNINMNQAEPGTIVIINGIGFEDPINNYYVRFNEYEVPIISGNNNAISTMIPIISPGRVMIKVIRAGYDDSNSLPFTVNELKLTGLPPGEIFHEINNELEATVSALENIIQNDLVDQGIITSDLATKFVQLLANEHKLLLGLNDDIDKLSDTDKALVDSILKNAGIYQLIHSSQFIELGKEAEFQSQDEFIIFDTLLMLDTMGMVLHNLQPVLTIAGILVTGASGGTAAPIVFLISIAASELTHFIDGFLPTDLKQLTIEVSNIEGSKINVNENVDLKYLGYFETQEPWQEEVVGALIDVVLALPGIPESQREAIEGAIVDILINLGFSLTEPFMSWKDDPPFLTETIYIPVKFYQQDLSDVMILVSPFFQITAVIGLLMQISGFDYELVPAVSLSNDNAILSSDYNSLTSKKEGDVDLVPHVWRWDVPDWGYWGWFTSLIPIEIEVYLTNDSSEAPPFNIHIYPAGDDVCGDKDHDGYADIACGGNDCNDNNPNVHPGITEDQISCNDGIDNDCDNLVDTWDPDCSTLCPDLDHDGYSSNWGCGPYLKHDCNDNDPNVNPGQVEICDDGIDNNCDGLIDGADMLCGNTEPNIGDGEMDGLCGYDVYATINVEPNVGPAGTPVTITMTFVRGAELIADIFGYQTYTSDWQFHYSWFLDPEQDSAATWSVPEIYGVVLTGISGVARWYAITTDGIQIAVGDILINGGGPAPSIEDDGIFLGCAEPVSLMEHPQLIESTENEITGLICNPH